MERKPEMKGVIGFGKKYVKKIGARDQGSVGGFEVRKRKRKEREEKKKNGN